MSFRCRYISLLVLASLGLAVSGALAQIDRANLNGTVTDPSGASIPNAKVEVVGPETCFKRQGLAMDRPRCFLILIFIAAASLLAGIGFKPCITVLAAPAGGPDFHISDSDLSHPLRIIAYGDLRFTDPLEVTATNPKVRRWSVERIATEMPDAVLQSGDVPWHGSQAADYDVFRRETQSWRDGHLHIYPALGNHEFSGCTTEQACLQNWWNAFPELRGRRWYSAQIGSSVYVLNLDSNSSLLAGSEQIGWIQAQLAGLPATVRFVFFNLHDPPVVDVQENGDPSHNGRPNEHALAEILAKAPEKSRVRFIVTAGHIHNYERFLQDDILYLVSGGGGADPRPIVRGPMGIFKPSSRHGPENAAADVREVGHTARLHGGDSSAI
jgi:acid phosphatase type 7